MYGAEVYGYENLDIIEKIHKDFLRKSQNLEKVPLYTCYTEKLGRYPLSIIIHTRMIAYCNKLIQGRTPKLSHQTHKHMLSHNNINDIKGLFYKSFKQNVELENISPFYQNTNTLPCSNSEQLITAFQSKQVDGMAPRDRRDCACSVILIP